MVSKKRKDELRAQLRAAGDELKALDAKRADARLAIEPVIVAALKAGIAPGEVLEMTPLSRETIRTIARIAGIPPAPRGGAR